MRPTWHYCAPHPQEAEGDVEIIIGGGCPHVVAEGLLDDDSEVTDDDET